MATESTTPLSALLRLLASSVESLEAAYAKEGVPFPSLDAPNAASPLAIDPEASHLARVAVAAAYQVIATVRDPIETVQHTAASYYASAALGVSVDLHVANILKEGGDEGVHIDEIAAQAGVPGDGLARVLRYLATRHIFREVKPDTFANNRISSTLIKKHLLAEIKADPEVEYEGSPAAATVGHHADEGMKGATALSSWIRTGHTTWPAPFNQGNGTDLDLFKWFEVEPYRGRRFHVAMTGSMGRYPDEIFTNAFDWAALPHGAQVVDVGASVGTVTHTLLRTFPNLRGVVQDLEKCIAQDAPKYWDENMPDALQDGRPVQGAAVYFLRNVLHDWPDAAAARILSILRGASAPESKLVIFDAIMPYACAYDGPFADAVAPVKAPWPLLANMGMALGGFVTWVDLHMLNAFNGKERTVGEFIELGRKSGWKLESLRPGMMAALVFSAA
ncbi:S-adenosyl-L-methionine-dependent methyltransferase [Vararia minispora EC-137]|uniref:S-adenosyl-L-methionine-dependent methyltransferase n=1 Tax=Vararia minispora EC-137 TaxID=1314806 RepID=A0ACB8QNE9_9AGAM|nr:S-adenosyl-L-methionine-dependent methyltransferase [Vararia minispora EC-137]